MIPTIVVFVQPYRVIYWRFGRHDNIVSKYMAMTSIGSLSRVTEPYQHTLYWFCRLCSGSTWHNINGNVVARIKAWELKLLLPWYQNLSHVFHFCRGFYRNDDTLVFKQEKTPRLSKKKIKIKIKTGQTYNFVKIINFNSVLFKVPIKQVKVYPFFV